MADDDYKPRLGVKMVADGGTEILDVTGKEPKPFIKIGQEDTLTTSPFGYDAAGKTLYFMDSRGRDTAALVTLDAKGKPTSLAEDPKADVQNALTHPKTGKVQAAIAAYDRRRWHVVDKAIQPDLDYLKNFVRDRLGA